MLPEPTNKTSKKEKRYVLYATIAITFTVFLIFIFFQFENFSVIISTISNAFAPFFAGLVLAFILNTFVKGIDQFVFKGINRRCENGKIWNKIKKPITLVMAYLLASVALGFIFFLIIPELTISIQSFIQSASETLPGYLESFFVWLDNTLKSLNLNIDIYEIQNTLLNTFNWTGLLTDITSAATDILASVLAATFNIVSIVFSIVMSLIYSVYFLADKDNLTFSFKKALYAYIPKKAADKVSLFLAVANNTFSNYVRGQLTECLILGSLCFIGMTIIGLNYALLISAILAVTALVPVFGAYIGASIGAFLLLLVNPMDALWFLIFVVILQQFEGNIIFPRVVGSSIGLPGLWTLTAVLVFGSMFGILGILIGTPTTAVVYTLLRHNTNRIIEEKGITQDILHGDELRIVYRKILLKEEEIHDVHDEEKNLLEKIKDKMKK